jgi:hypothetical protein
MEFDIKNQTVSKSKKSWYKRPMYAIPIAVCLLAISMVSAAWLLNLFGSAQYEIVSNIGENRNITVTKYWDSQTLNAISGDIDVIDTVKFYNNWDNELYNLTGHILLNTTKADNPNDECFGFDEDINVWYTNDRTGEILVNGSELIFPSLAYTNVSVHIQAPRYSCAGNVTSTFEVIDLIQNPIEP